MVPLGEVIQTPTRTPTPTQKLGGNRPLTSRREAMLFMPMFQAVAAFRQENHERSAPFSSEPANRRLRLTESGRSSTGSGSLPSL